MGGGAEQPPPLLPHSAAEPDVFVSDQRKCGWVLYYLKIDHYVIIVSVNGSMLPGVI